MSFVHVICMNLENEIFHIKNYSFYKQVVNTCSFFSVKQTGICFFLPALSCHFFQCVCISFTKKFLYQKRQAAQSFYPVLQIDTKSGQLLAPFIKRKKLMASLNQCHKVQTTCFYRHLDINICGTFKIVLLFFLGFKTK